MFARNGRFWEATASRNARIPRLVCFPVLEILTTKVVVKKVLDTTGLQNARLIPMLERQVLVKYSVTLYILHAEPLNSSFGMAPHSRIMAVQTGNIVIKLHFSQPQARFPLLGLHQSY